VTVSGSDRVRVETVGRDDARVRELLGDHDQVGGGRIRARALDLDHHGAVDLGLGTRMS
jgi:hypothetical protein